jgi:hypothetical protein
MGAPPRWGVVLLCAVLGGLCLKGFYDIAGSYRDFVLPQSGTIAVPELELAFYAWYGLFGVLIALCAVGIGRELGLEARARDAFEALAREPARPVFALALCGFAASLSFRRLVLEGQPIADDESTYLFIARTLLAGRLTNPVPELPEYFRNQFVVLNEHGWHGKYPIGQGVWLALGEALHLRDLMPALTCGLAIGLTFAVGRRLFSPRRALFGTALLCLSPHFVWTCGTLLSQPTCGLSLLCGVWAMLRAFEERSLLFAALAGLSFGFGVLVRPMPGAIFAAVAGVCWAVRCARAADAGERGWLLRGLLLFGLASAVIGALLLVANYVQNGHPLASGQAEVHGGLRMFRSDKARVANSVFGSALRENFWLFGAPWSLAPLLFCRPARERWLFWGILAAELAYRVSNPKTVVSTTGPIYLTEIVPLLSLGAADGLVRWTSSARRIGPALLTTASLAAALTMFWPIELRTIRNGVEARLLVYRALEVERADRALVFADALAFPESAVTWAYYPDNPSPSLDDDILFVRLPQRDPARSVQHFWQTHFPERRAFLFMWTPKGEPLFREVKKGE